MVNYQIQYKEKVNQNELSGPPNEANEFWRVVCDMPTLQSAISTTKSLVKKYGYENFQICKVTSIRVEVHAE
ncbi:MULTISPECIES: hypothetical protein [unclassified Clostridioides]|uniref:hypothetical protein n=1 Tax=unclassified Clostridioides TaxID=2635829 RepID=UPI001D105A29|nr:hypothetical protein [Clostridioides sp. ES-S-0001-02]MCC0638974.1 hypothetical protein [Clostridioides sp. ES-S-0049-03]MCC0657299.1 hypothetical protein [Clostridioides sp. ES-S-0123-01]MCC0672704.1 hypothetical protein [Clostridioides sp. ES-S-0145-01]MCC0675364.1 hypothetical protein [Clostridioides sp. ES-W-0018-02]MCC0679980.1 hypothetical protein [Clostridioides sp. ES-S-0005-03]MCC0709827.1 hypothetical protein [Clostridioides sp. ES-W-0017-02]UDN46215.1 hypothetical protein JJJ25